MSPRAAGSTVEMKNPPPISSGGGFKINVTQSEPGRRAAKQQLVQQRKVKIQVHAKISR